MDHEEYVRKVIIKNLTNFDLGAHGLALANISLICLCWVTNVSFEQNFWHISKFLGFAKFHPLQVRNGQTLDFKPNFQRDWKFLGFAKFHPPQVQSAQSHFWVKFSTQIKIFLDFVKFHPLLVRSGENSHFWAKFSMRQKISGFCHKTSWDSWSSGLVSRLWCSRSPDWLGHSRLGLD